MEGAGPCSKGRDFALRSLQALGKKGCGHVRAAAEGGAEVLLAEAAQPGEEGATAVLLEGQEEQEGGRHRPYEWWAGRSAWQTAEGGE